MNSNQIGLGSYLFQNESSISPETLIQYMTKKIDSSAKITNHLKGQLLESYHRLPY